MKLDIPKWFRKVFDTVVKFKMCGIRYFILISILVIGSFKTNAIGQESKQSLRFKPSNDLGAFEFNTGILKGVLRQSGKSTGLVPVTLVSDSSTIAVGEGLFNHYRVFTRGKRFGYGARRWPSTANLENNGDVTVIWPVTDERPFELRGTYHWVSKNTLDLKTTIHAKETLADFEVFLAAYYDPAFIDSRIYSSIDSLGQRTKGFARANKKFGEWQAFARDSLSKNIIDDGRWNLEPHPLEWTFISYYDQPLAIRRNPQTGTAVVIMAKRKDCFGVFTPFNEEKHISNYLSLFGSTIVADSSATALTRLVVLSNSPDDAEILEIAKAFLSDQE